MAYVSVAQAGGCKLATLDCALKTPGGGWGDSNNVRRWIPSP